MRRFGLPTVDLLPASAHVVYFYQHGKDLLEVFAQFCAAGLEEGDCCLWITTPPWTEGLALHEVAKRLPTVEQYVTSGHLQLIAGGDWYLATEAFDLNGTLAKAKWYLEEARRRGGTRIRVCGIPYRVGGEREWSAYLEYEQRAHRVITEKDVLALCAYRHGSLHEQAKKGLMQTHHAVLERKEDGWHYGPSVVLPAP